MFGGGLPVTHQTVKQNLKVESDLCDKDSVWCICIHTKLNDQHKIERLFSKKLLMCIEHEQDNSIT
ncbi:hypothetical protein PaeCFBP13512_20285 [Paenibacillus sp. CFBP13512]|nr:hypothetical protein PaeCFBP13512_20285 [Paenibacillus sp. CFBP13512]